MDGVGLVDAEIKKIEYGLSIAIEWNDARMLYEIVFHFPLIFAVGNKYFFAETIFTAYSVLWNVGALTQSPIYVI